MHSDCCHTNDNAEIQSSIRCELGTHSKGSFQGSLWYIATILYGMPYINQAMQLLCMLRAHLHQHCTCKQSGTSAKDHKESWAGELSHAWTLGWLVLSSPIHKAQCMGLGLPWIWEDHPLLPMLLVLLGKPCMHTLCEELSSFSHHSIRQCSALPTQMCKAS